MRKAKENKINKQTCTQPRATNERNKHQKKPHVRMTF